MLGGWKIGVVCNWESTETLTREINKYFGRGPKGRLLEY